MINFIANHADLIFWSIVCIVIVCYDKPMFRKWDERKEK